MGFHIRSESEAHLLTRMRNSRSDLLDKEEEYKRKTDQIFLTRRRTDLDKEDKEEEMWKKLREPFTNFNWDSMKLELARHHLQTSEGKINRFCRQNLKEMYIEMSDSATLHRIIHIYLHRVEVVQWDN